jgi:hypothetical protein
MQNAKLKKGTDRGLFLLFYLVVIVGNVCKAVVLDNAI